MSSTYPAQLQNDSGIITFEGDVIFTGDAPGYGPNPITSGALNQTSAWVSGTAKQIDMERDTFLGFDFVTDATDNNATCTVALSPDNTTFTTVASIELVAALNTTGAVTFPAGLTVPAGWYVKLTFAHGTPSVGTYY